MSSVRYSLFFGHEPPCKTKKSPTSKSHFKHPQNEEKGHVPKQLFAEQASPVIFDVTLCRWQTALQIPWCVFPFFVLSVCLPVLLSFCRSFFLPCFPFSLSGFLAFFHSFVRSSFVLKLRSFFLSFFPSFLPSFFVSLLVIVRSFFILRSLLCLSLFILALLSLSLSLSLFLGGHTVSQSCPGHDLACLSLCFGLLLCIPQPVGPK